MVGEKVETDEDFGWGKRLWYTARGIFYAFLCYITVSILVGSSSGSSNEKQQAEAVFGWPAGRWIVGRHRTRTARLGNRQRLPGLERRLQDDPRMEEMFATTRRRVTRFGFVDYLARAVVFGIAGVLTVRAALEYDPNEAVGLDGALQMLADRTFRPLLLGIVAAGLAAYGLFYFARARNRKV